MALATSIPDAYIGREQAYIKHKLLENYLQKLFLIIGTSRGVNTAIELCYVDCFAGPWGDDSEAMDSTSIAISLRVLQDCQQALSKLGHKSTIKALYVEKDAKAFDRLNAYLANATPPEVTSHAMKGDFVELRQDILNWVGETAFSFFFIDPKGWTEVAVSTLEPLLRRPRSEFLINFMYNFVNRTMSMADWQPEMKELIGQELDLTGQNPIEREKKILDAYRASLKSCVPENTRYPARSAYARVLNPVKDRTHYHLVYLTSHPLGVLKFMEISAHVDVVQKKVRAERKEMERERKTGVQDMFGMEELIDTDAGNVSSTDVDDFWLDYLTGGIKVVDQSEFACILEEKDWFPDDLQMSLFRLIERGLVANLDAKSKRPKKPLHFELPGGERLALVKSENAKTIL
jgi:three-Cys-motif partner protein